MAEKIKFKDDPKKIENILIGFNRGNFLLAFNSDKNGVVESSFELPAEKMTELIEALFDAGRQYEEMNHVDIGFGIGDENK